MAEEFVWMDRSQLDGAIYATADTVRSVYGAMAEVTMKPAYAAAAMAQYEWNAAAGYAGVVGDLVDAIASEVSGSGITVESGSVTLSAVSSSVTVTPEAGRLPFFCFIVCDTISYGENRVNMVAYIKTPAAISIDQGAGNIANLYIGFVAESRETLSANSLLQSLQTYTFS